MVSEVAPSASQSHLIVSYVFRVVIELASSASQPCGVDPTLCSALHALKNGAVVFVMCSQQRYTTYTTEVHNILKKTAQKTCELDPLPTSLLYDNIDLLLPALTNIINRSLLSGEIPLEFKSAVVKPLHKKASLDPSQMKN